MKVGSAARSGFDELGRASDGLKRGPANLKHREGVVHGAYDLQLGPSFFTQHLEHAHHAIDNREIGYDDSGKSLIRKRRWHRREFPDGIGRDFPLGHSAKINDAGPSLCALSLFPNGFIPFSDGPIVNTAFPTVNASTTALAAAGGTTGIIVDNDSSLTQTSNIYYSTKTGVSLVKATQSGLN